MWKSGFGGSRSLVSHTVHSLPLNMIMPLVPMSAEPTANVDIPKNIPVKTPKLEKIEGTSSKKVKVNKPKQRVNYKQAGSGNCSCS